MVAVEYTNTVYLSALLVLVEDAKSLVDGIGLRVEDVLVAPLVYQSTTSLGLAEVQSCSPKVVVATRAAAQGS